MYKKLLRTLCIMRDCSIVVWQMFTKAVTVLVIVCCCWKNTADAMEKGSDEGSRGFSSLARRGYWSLDESTVVDACRDREYVGCDQKKKDNIRQKILFERKDQKVAGSCGAYAVAVCYWYMYQRDLAASALYLEYRWQSNAPTEDNGSDARKMFEYAQNNGVPISGTLHSKKLKKFMNKHHNRLPAINEWEKYPQPSSQRIYPSSDLDVIKIMDFTTHGKFSAIRQAVTDHCCPVVLGVHTGPNSDVSESGHYVTIFGAGVVDESPVLLFKNSHGKGDHLGYMYESAVEERGDDAYQLR